MTTRNYKHRSRSGATMLLFVFLLVVILGFMAFAVDIGFITLTRTQLQVAADSAAMAAAAQMVSTTEAIAGAKQYAAYHLAGGKPVTLNDSDVEFGTWDTSTRRFTPATGIGNAVRVTARRDASAGGQAPLFFGRIFGQDSFASRASAVATANPRDIAFVIDVSGSMNDDTDPNRTAGINSNFASQGYPTIGTDLMNQVYADFGFNVAYPNEPEQCIGHPLGVTTSGGDPLSQLTSYPGPLSQTTIPLQYRIQSADSSSVCRQKAFSWAMDVQIPQIMPAARPTPGSTTNYNYWSTYLTNNYAQIGYRSYTRFMMHYGRELKPDGVNYTPLSQFSPNCPWHLESTAGGTFSFPPREMPTHAARRAMIAAIKLIDDRNQNISDTNQRDWVSIISFDSLAGGGPVILVPLTGDYGAAMAGCTRLQACSDTMASTATETGLITARNHIKPQNEGGCGRTASNKIVVLLTDGKPNLYSSSHSQITSYEQSHPSSDFYGEQYPQDAAMMQTSIMHGNRWYTFPVGIGLQCDYDFMDRMGRIGATADGSGRSPRGSGNPADYEAVLTQIFQNIITNPKLRLVQ